MYPDRRAVDCLPGSEQIFSLQRYKEELGKSYQRITLFLCLKTDYTQSLYQECMFSGDESASDIDEVK